MPLLGGPIQVIIKDEVRHARAKNELGQMQEEQNKDDVVLARTLNDDAAESDTLTKFARYENSIERALFRSLHELQRLQAARKGDAVPAPQMVDVEVSVSPQ